MNTKLEPIEIKVPVFCEDTQENIDFLSRFFVSIARPSSMEERVLSYIIQHSNDGIYSIYKGSTQIACEYLSISSDTFQYYIKKLTELKIIKKLINGRGKKNYIYYEFMPAIKKIFKKRGEVHINIHTSTL